MIYIKPAEIYSRIINDLRGKRDVILCQNPLLHAKPSKLTGISSIPFSTEEILQFHIHPCMHA